MNSNKRINLLVNLVRLALIILIACVLISVIALVVSDDPWTATNSFFLGPFTLLRRAGNIIEATSPLMFTILTVIIIFGSGQFPMIVEGSFFIGIVGAMTVAIACKLPGGTHLTAAILFGRFYGVLVALVPMFLKMKWNMSELVTSIISNYVVQFFVVYMVSYHFREVSGPSLASLKFEKTSKLPVILDGTRIHAGVVLGIVFCVLVWFFLYRTSLGVKLRIIDDNPLFVRYTDLKATGFMVAAQVIAGAIAGMGGGARLLSIYSRFRWATAPGYGWTGIMVALPTRSDLLLVPLVTIFVGYLNVGADIMACSSNVGREVVDIIQGVMMFLITTNTLLKGWR